MFRSMCRTICSRVGFEFLLRRATPDMIMPGVQYPHCKASAFKNASWTGCSWLSFSSPSIVVICLLATLPTCVTHERVCCPSTSTVQAPHCASPQPYLAPVKSRSLRSTLNKLVCGSTSTVNFFPLTFSVVGFDMNASLPNYSFGWHCNCSTVEIVTRNGCGLRNHVSRHKPHTPSALHYCRCDVAPESAFAGTRRSLSDRHQSCCGNNPTA